MRRILNWIVAVGISIGLMGAKGSPGARSSATSVLRSKVALHVPCTVNGNVPAPATQAEWTAKALAYFARLFRGANSTAAQGAWLSDAHGLVVESVNIVSAFGSDAALEQHKNAVRKFALAMKQDMGQEQIALEWNGTLELV